MKKKYLIVIANYYKDISEGLLESSKKLLPKNNIIKIITVPGVFEIPVTISKTNMSLLKEGDNVNIEFDILAKYTEQLLNKREI